MAKIIDLAGKSFGRLTVVELHHINVRKFWLCKCECGNEKVVSGTDIVTGRTKSCGCLQKEAVTQNAKLATKAKSLPFPYARRLCNLFEDMRKRCLNPNARGYENYGGRGITICEGWLENRRAFYAWATDAGYSPGLEIERIDVNGNYSPENCRFVIRADQYHNTRRNVFLEWQGKRQTATQWANELGLSPKLLQKRIRNGWPVEKALFTSVAA